MITPKLTRRVPYMLIPPKRRRPVSDLQIAMTPGKRKFYQRKPLSVKYVVPVTEIKNSKL